MDAIGKSRDCQSGSDRERRIGELRPIVRPRSSAFGCNPYTRFRRIIVGRVLAENDFDRARSECGPRSKNVEDRFRARWKTSRKHSKNVGLRDIERAARVLDARPAALGADRVICYSIR
jgi:hypothetical protein